MLSFSVEEFAGALGVGYYVLVYGVGIIAMTLSVIAFQFKRRVTIIISNFLGQTCWVAYFLLQGDLTSAIACALSAIMLAVFAKQDKWSWVKSPICVATFIVVLSGFSIVTFRVWSDVFPLLAGVFAVIANSRTNETKLRWYSILWCGFWLLNSAFKLYPVAFANDLFCTISTIVGLIRYREKKVNSDKQL